MNTKDKSTARYFLLINLLQSFTKPEIDRFIRFVRSPYFNTDQRIITLLENLSNHILSKNLFNDGVQMKLYQVVFGDKGLEKVLKEPQKKLLRAKMSVLTKLAQRFLTIEALDETPTCESELLNKKLLEKKQFRLFNRLIKRNKKELDNEKAKGIEEYALNFQLETAKMNFLYQNGTLTLQKENNFPALINSLNMYYLTNVLKLQSTMYSIMNVNAKASYDFSVFKGSTTLLTLPQYANEPLVILYQVSICLMKDHEEATYFKLLSLLNDYDAMIPRSYLLDFYFVACNFCAHQIRIGHIDYNRKFFELFKIMDTKNLLMKGAYIKPIMLKNVVSLSCHVQEFEWATAMVQKYYPLTKRTERESAYHFNLGVIAFYKKNYKAAISHLIRVEKIHLAYDLDSRILLLKSYYEIDKSYDERTVQIFRSAERFVQTKKSMPTSHKKSYKNFIQILINLYRVRHQVGKQNVMSVQNKISKMDFIISKKWLLEKMEELGLSLP